MASAAFATLMGASVGIAAAQDVPGFISSFEAAGPTEITYPTGYAVGPVVFQDGWEGGTRGPRVQTSAEIAAELTAAGLAVGQPVHSGDQALMVVKFDTNTETSAGGGGYFARNVFDGLEDEKKVTADFWVRPLASGLGADPAGTPAGNEKTIGERQGNFFIGIADNTPNPGGEKRAAAIRFGIVAEAGNNNPYTNVVTRTIDYGSAISNPWVASGLTWEPDVWYNVRFDLDYEAKTYDFYLNSAKVNAAPIQFYDVLSQNATRFFVSRGTNQAAGIVDDVSVTALVAPPVLPGDFDVNGKVDGSDFLMWQRDPSIGDLADWKANFGRGAATATVGAIPEPAGLALALGALLACAGCRRR